MVKSSWIYIALLALIIPGKLFAQNLVPNGSFELKNNCPTFIGSIDYAPAYNSFPTVKDWVSPIPINNSSPDFFHNCAAPVTGAHVPEANFGYQYARTGDAYGGIIAWGRERNSSGNYFDIAEYLETRLSQPMLAGQKYCVSFFVNPSINPSLLLNYISIEQVGLHFSKNQVSQPSGYTLNLPYHVRSTQGQYLTDTSAWIKVSGLYTASGGEQWMTVGTFSSTTPNNIGAYPPVPNPNRSYYAYMYLDDFNVVPINTTDTEKISHSITVCDPDNVSVAMASTGYEGNFAWNSGETTKQLNAVKTGTYWCVSEADCHFYVDTFHVIFDPALKLSAGNDTGNCFNQPVRLQAGKGGSFKNFLWSTGSTADTITVTQSGVFFITATNECGTQIDTIRVSIQPPTEKPEVSDTSFCQNTGDPQIRVNGTNITWYTTLNSILGTPQQPFIFTHEPGKDVIYVTQKIGYCESERAPVQIDIKYLPRNEIEENITMCEKYKYAIGNNIKGVSYTWNTGETNCCIIPREEGIFKRIVTNECGTYVDTAYITFSECNQCIAVPNAFTPNRDGSNDQFAAIITCPIENFIMKIYNRWGNKIFETRSTAEAWDGRLDGSLCEEGTYVYTVEYRSATTLRNNILKGTVALIR